jgi:L-2-hydroxycarboxylate dehydrogenase (NAD+)
MLTQIEEIRDLLLQAMKQRQIQPEDAELIADDYLDAELAGSLAHGLSKFLLIDYALTVPRAEPVVVSQRGAIARLDGRRQLGQLAARKAAALAGEIALREGVGLVTLVNCSRYSRLAPYAAAIADLGLAALVTNNAGPRAVAPYGSREPILGTNPIAFGFPAADGPVVIDFSTAQQVWGEIRQATLEDRQLAPDAFLDADGNLTTEPTAVEAVVAFGGHKGSALCLAIELLAGLVAGAQMGLAVRDEYDLGALFAAFELSRSGVPDSMAAIASLLWDIRSARPLAGQSAVLVPGDRSKWQRATALAAGCLDVKDETLEMLRTMAAGGIGLQGGRLTT